MNVSRTEKDSMGTMEVPAHALYGASTQRAVLNFPISGTRFGREFIRALGMVKWCAAEANLELGKLDEQRATLIAQAAAEIMDGKLDEHFPIDIFQTGSATSTNMNANEVIANRCSQLAGEPIGSKKPVDPNDHVNMGQSSNDVIPTVIHVAVAERLRKFVVPALEQLHASLERKALEFWDIVKIGRTHLMDATPVRLGQVFRGYARQAALGVERGRAAIRALEELPLGGTAVGTGLNCHPDFAGIVMRHLDRHTGIAFREAKDHFEAQGAKDGLVEASGLLKAVAVSLAKISNDIRWLGSGPSCAIGELRLPATQPGSSIMPGKVNPVMSEALLQVCAKVIGNDTTVTWAASMLSNFELNVGMPVIAQAMLESCRLLAAGVDTFRERCLDGIKDESGEWLIPPLQANTARCAELIEGSMAMVTSLNPFIGYQEAAKIAKESFETGKSVRAICTERGVLPPDVLAKALDPFEMTKPGGDGVAGG
jgi:fumarate hydratase class II